MIKVIEGKRYNTETAKCVFSYWNGRNSTDFGYRIKTLYLTQNGAWFIHHKGGPFTDMAVNLGSGGRGWGELLEAISADDAFGFLQAHSDDAEALEAIDLYFASRVEEA